VDSQSAQCLFKVLSGPHQGAEVLLSPGSYILGRSDQCDIILSDTWIQDQHLKIDYRPPGLSLLPLAENVFLQGQLLSDKPNPYEFFELITIGTTQLMIGPVDATWPPFSLFEKPTDLPSPPDQVSPSTDSLTDAIAIGNGESMAIDKRIAQPMEVPQKKTGQGWFLNRLPWIAASISFLVAIGFTCLFAIHIYKKGQPPASNAPLSLAPFHEVLKLNAADKNVTLETIQGQIVATGCVQTEKQRLSLRRSLLAVDPRIWVRLYSAESMASAGQALLNEMGLAAQAQAGPTCGHLILSGYVPTAKQLSQVKAHMMQDISGLTHIEDHTLTAEQVVGLATTLLEQHGLLGAIQFVGGPRWMQVQGALTRSQSKQWDNVIWPSLKALINGRVHIQDAISRSNPKEIDRQYFDSEIESVNEGPFGWIGLKNGQKYFAGSVLPSGYTIITLNQNGIVLQRGDDTVTFKPQNL